MSEQRYNTGSNGIGLGFSGYYKVQVVNAKTGEIVEDRPWKKNLILNCGMNQVASSLIADLNKYAIAGTGSRPNAFTSSTSTITQSNDLVYLYERTGHFVDWTSSLAGYNVGVEIGDTLEYNNGSRSFVLSVSPYTLQVRPTYSIDLANSQSFTLWKTSQQNLHYEYRRAGPNLTDSDYLPGSGSGIWNCGSEVRENGRVIHRRTYNFGEETYATTYTEAGVSWRSTPAASSSFSRVLFDDPVVVNPGYRLRLVHDMHVIYTPYVERYFIASIGTWPVLPSINTYATESIQNLKTTGQSAISYINADGTTVGGKDYDGATLDPASSGNHARGFVSSNSESIAPYTTSYDRTNNWAEESSGQWISSYIPDTWQRFKSCSYGIYEAVSSNIRTIGLGLHYVSTPNDWRPYEQNYNHLIVRFDQNQTKTNLQKASFTWKWSWDRDLS